MAELEEPLILHPNYASSDDSYIVYIDSSPTGSSNGSNNRTCRFVHSSEQVKKTDEIRFVIKSFRQNRIGRQEFLRKIKGLLYQCPEFLVVINMLMLSWIDISMLTMPLHRKTNSENPISNHVVDFIKRNMEKFPRNDERMHESLLYILILDHRQTNIIDDVYFEMSTLFHDKPESLEVFKLLLRHHPSKTSAEEVHEPKPNNGSKKEESSNFSYLVPFIACTVTCVVWNWG